MKKLYLIGGTMGVGKSSVCEKLNNMLPNSVFLDGDWCWKAAPFVVNAETKSMVMDNICHLLNNFINCSVYENIIFCWVMHEQSIIDEIISNLNVSDVEIICVSLVASQDEITKRLQKDIRNGLRGGDIIERSISRLPCYDNLHTNRIDTSNLDIDEIARKISKL